MRYNGIIETEGKKINEKFPCIVIDGLSEFSYTFCVNFDCSLPCKQQGRSRECNYGAVEVRSCKDAPVDLVIVMDESGSIGYQNYETALDAVAGLTERLHIGTTQQDSRVGMVLFDQLGYVNFGLDKYTTNSDVASEIRKSTYSAGGTDIAAGMHTALTEVFAKVPNRDVRKVMIVITDGEDSSDVAAERAIAEKNDIITYAIGIGEGINSAELVRAAGDPKRVYTFANYDALAGAIDQLCTSIVITPAPRGCKCNTTDTWLDLIFVIDSSKAVNKQDFMAVRNLAAAFIQSIPVSQEIGKFSRVGIINMGDQAQVVGELTSYNTTDQAANAMRNMPYLNSNQANLRDALNKATNMLDSDHDHRKNVQNVVVLFSSVNEPCDYQGYRKLRMKVVDHNPCRIAAHLRENNNIILTVGLKYDGTEKYPVLNVGSDCYKLNFDEHFPENFTNAICRANCYCLPPYVQFTDKCTEYGECVYQQGQPLDFFTAELTCQNYNATMIDVLSAEKDLFIRSNSFGIEFDSATNVSYEHHYKYPSFTK
ncbi:unnamed protein product [Anisakis simplex]|uniref:VWFA domain-containing protein n=1 Tax=Anisakis simplex TaxID=6269 RepID=A0A0M3IZP7_ANISI|nr:unnamed protein product [Anisakis simplex]